MRLWKRRPLSEDLSQKKLNIPYEMPPTLVYISPGNQKISRKSSLKNSDQLLNFHTFSETVSNENHFENDNNFKNYRFRSFRDYESKDSVTFENTLKKINLLNKDCKSYITPVSQEWSPVKDIMKISRSASVPFQARNSNKVNTPVESNKNSNLKSHLSLSEKIKIFLRNRSTSRKSKANNLLTNEDSSMKLMTGQDLDQVLSRNSRSRMKDAERTKSLYEPPITINETYFKIQNPISENQISQFGHINNKINTLKQVTGRKEENQEIKVQPFFNGKSEKNFNISTTDIQRRMKTRLLNSENSQRISMPGLSSKFISETKPKADFSKLCETGRIHPHNAGHQNKNCNIKFKDISVLNFHNSSTIYNSSNITPCKSSQTNVSALSDKKITNILESHIPPVRPAARHDSKRSNEKIEYLLPSRVMAPMLKNTDNRNSSTNQRKQAKNAEEDDYVTLAEVNAPFPPLNNIFMTQSLCVPVLPDFSNLNHKYENNSNTQSQQKPVFEKGLIYRKYQQRISPFNGEIRKRPISCMASVNADCKLLGSDLDNRDKYANIYPTSPYLSQYSKLYSLRTNDLDIIKRYGNEMVDVDDLMTLSQHSAYCKLSTAISKDQVVKLSIDSGLVDDINTFHSDYLQQTLNY